MSWRRLLWTVSRPVAPGLLLSVLAGVGAAGAGVGLMATAAWLISRAALHPPVLHLMVAIVAVRAFGISRGALRYVERLAGHDAALRALTTLRVRLFTELERLAPAGLAAYRRADLMQRLVGDVDAVLDMLTRVVLPYTITLTVGVGSVALIATMSPIAGLALAAGLIVVGAVVPWLQRSAARHADGRLAPLRGELASGTVELLHGLDDLVAYGAEGGRLDRLADIDARLRRAERRSAAAAGISAAVTALATGICLLTGLIAGAVAVRAGTLAGELLAVVVLTPLAVFEAAAGLPAAAQRFAGARAALGRLAEVVATPSPVVIPARPAEVPDGPHTIRLENVSAEWQPGRTAVHGVSLDLSPGRRVALVGPSGSGKSTVAALLVRWLDPVAGRITLDGVDVRDIAPDRVRQIVGYLPEDAHLFDTTIEQNLRIGRRDATPAQLREVLEATRSADWINALPLGMDTRVGEHGMQLSGGQRRRLALARALLADFRVLILDEPTEHLDDETAAALTRDLLAAAAGRSVLLITHRVDDLSGVDEVVRLPGSAEAPAASPEAQRDAGLVVG
jgi:thiol reductant ABC exporter CydC subunit